MLLDITIEKESLSIDITSPFKLDTEGICKEIAGFASGRGADVSGLDIAGLLPKMVRGIAGCEDGCPANAQSLVRRGFENFAMEYVEGGILVAQAPLPDGRQVVLKMFPEF